MAIHVTAGYGPVYVIGEYVKAIDDIDFTNGTSRKSMSAWNSEAGYTIELSLDVQVFVAQFFENGVRLALLALSTKSGANPKPLG